MSPSAIALLASPAARESSVACGVAACNAADARVAPSRIAAAVRAASEGCGRRTTTVSPLGLANPPVTPRLADCGDAANGCGRGLSGFQNGLFGFTAPGGGG